MCYFASIFYVLTRFRAATFHVADFSDDESGALGRGLMLSDAAGVDGLTYLPSLLLLSLLDGLKPCLSYLISSEIFDVISV